MDNQKLHEQMRNLSRACTEKLRDYRDRLKIATDANMRRLARNRAIPELDLVSSVHPFLKAEIVRSVLKVVAHAADMNQYVGQPWTTHLRDCVEAHIQAVLKDIQMGGGLEGEAARLLLQLGVDCLLDRSNLRVSSVLGVYACHRCDSVSYPSRGLPADWSWRALDDTISLVCLCPQCSLDQSQSCPR